MTLDEIDLTNMVWTNQFKWNALEQTTDRGLTGSLIVQQGIKQYGRPIILSKSWLNKSVLEALQTKEAEANLTMTLTLDNGTEYTVIFDRESTAIEATQVFDQSNPNDDCKYETTIRLLTVEPETETEE
jgi:hypothetical protein